VKKADAMMDTLATHLDVLVLKSLDIESDRRYGLDCFVTFVLKSVENGGFSSIVQAENQDADLFGSKEAIEQPAHQYSHLCRDI
jgi:hypothetical protein